MSIDFENYVAAHELGDFINDGVLCLPHDPRFERHVKALMEYACPYCDQFGTYFANDWDAKFKARGFPPIGDRS